MGPRELAGEGANTHPIIMPIYQAGTRYLALRRTSSPSTTLTFRIANESDGRTVYSYRTVQTGVVNVNEGWGFSICVDVADPSFVRDPGISVIVDTHDWGYRLLANNTGWIAVGGGVPPTTAWNPNWRPPTGGTIKNVAIAFEEWVGAGYGYITDLRILTWRPTGGS